jgi:hypothetical protein
MLKCYVKIYTFLLWTDKTRYGHGSSGGLYVGVGEWSK